MSSSNNEVNEACLDGVDFWHENVDKLMLDDLVSGIQAIAYEDAARQADSIDPKIAAAIRGRIQELHK